MSPSKGRRGARASETLPPPAPPPRSSRLALTAVALVVVIAAGGLVWRKAGRRPPPTAPLNVLLVTLDTTRADHLGCYGRRDARTPRLDRLAAEGVRFENAMAAAPITLPSHASILTALYPFEHGVRNN